MRARCLALTASLCLFVGLARVVAPPPPTSRFYSAPLQLPWRSAKPPFHGSITATSTRRDVDRCWRSLQRNFRAPVYTGADRRADSSADSVNRHVAGDSNNHSFFSNRTVTAVGPRLFECLAGDRHGSRFFRYACNSRVFERSPTTSVTLQVTAWWGPKLSNSISRAAFNVAPSASPDEIKAQWVGDYNCTVTAVSQVNIRHRGNATVLTPPPACHINDSHHPALSC